ncbi:MAG: hypothetical protein ACO1NS_12620 [Daejeonella sp.]
MKKSNIYLISGLLIFLASILAFDFGLRAQYAKGDFRLPYSQFVDVNFRDFDTIRVNASTLANVKFIQGSFRVRVFEQKTDIIKLAQQGGVLTIDANTDGKDRYEDSHFALIISCPKLIQLIADDKYMEKGKLKIDTNAKFDFYHNNRLMIPAKKVVVEGFSQDSISIIQNNGSHVMLSNNRIKRLSAITGMNPESSSFLTIDSNNVFNTAFLDIRNRSQLFMAKAKVGALDYRLAPGAKITYSEASSVLFR